MQDRIGHKECDACRNRQGFFDCLTSEEAEKLCSGHTHIHYKPLEKMFKQGGFAPNILYISSGVVKIYTNHFDRHTILTLETKGTFLGLPVLFGRKIFPYSVVALDKVECCQFDINDVQEVIERNGVFASRVIQQMNDYTLRSFERLNSLTMKQVHGRFADIIICLAARIYKSPVFDMALSRKDMAELSGMSVESLSRIIRDFNDEGIIRTVGRKLEILDIDGLRRISNLG